MNRSAPLPASRCRGVLRTAADGGMLASEPCKSRTGRRAGLHRRVRKPERKALAGKRPTRFVAPTSDAAFSLHELLRGFLPCDGCRHEPAPSRRGDDSARASDAFPGAAPAAVRAGTPASPPLSSAAAVPRAEDAVSRRIPRLNRAVSCRSGCRRCQTRCLRRWRRRPSLHRRPKSPRRCRTDRTRRHSVP
jgi:hypothetical protein